MTIRPLSSSGILPAHQVLWPRPVARQAKPAEPPRQVPADRVRQAESALSQAQDLVQNVQKGLVRNSRFADSAKANERLVDSAVETAREIVSASRPVFGSAPASKGLGAYEAQEKAGLPPGFSEAGDALRSVPGVLKGLDTATERGVAASNERLEGLSDRLQRIREGLGDGLSRVDTRA